MTIKSFLSPSFKILSTFSIGLLLVLNIAVIVFSDWDLFLFAFISFIGYTLYYLCILIAYGRIFKFDESGCTVFLGKRYKKHYSWDIIIPTYYPSISTPCKSFHIASLGLGKFDKVVFLKRKKETNNQQYRLNHYALTNPFGIFICFSEKGQEDFWSNIYTAERSEFLEKLDQWGINVQYRNNK